LDQVVLFVVERGAAEVGHAGGVHMALVEGALAGGPHALGDHGRGLMEADLAPRAAARRAVLDLRRARLMRDELVAGRTFGTEMPSGDRRLRIAFDGEELALAMVNQLTTSDAAVRTDGARYLRAVVLGAQLARPLAHGRVLLSAQLANERPFEEELGEHRG